MMRSRSASLISSRTLKKPMRSCSPDSPTAAGVGERIDVGNSERAILMEGRLHELIQDYLREHAPIRGDRDKSFRLSSLRAYAAQYPSRYPEYVVHSGRIRIAVELARHNGEILPAPSGGRDDLLWLRRDFTARDDASPV